MPLPPKPLDPELPMPFEPLLVEPELPPMPFEPPLLEPDTVPALPRVPAETVPALRLAVLLEALLGTDDTLLPADEALTSPAIEADLAVAALTRADASEADLLVAATPPPVPPAWPETADLDASSAVLREAACAEDTVDGPLLLGAGGGE
jgi:hypothetical protein